MRERLNEAIEKTNAWVEGHVMFNRQDMLLLLAASRAYTCEECGGLGAVGYADDHDEIVYEECTACKADRELADSEEVD